jgi:hypothetical protein
MSSSPQCFQHINPHTKNRSVSDRSVLHSQGVQGCVIAKLDNEVIVQGCGATEGRVDDVSSYRTEICGNITTFTVILLLRKSYGFPTPSIEHVCDNQSAISATWKDKTISVFDHMKPDAHVDKVARNAIADIQESLWLTHTGLKATRANVDPHFLHKDDLIVLHMASQAEPRLLSQQK